MAFLSKITYTGDGLVQSFSVTFPYIIKEHIKVYLDGVLTTAYTWDSGSTILMDVVPPNDTSLLIKRVTPQTPLVVWTDGATLRAADLNKQALQIIYICQETLDNTAAGDGVSETAILAAAQAEASALAAQAAQAATELLPKDASWITTGTFDLARIPTITAAKLDTDAVTTAKIQDDAVTTAKIADGAVTAAKLGDLSSLGIEIPPGVMADYGGVVAPSGWLGCDGTAISRTTYADLYAAIGTTWGAGNGTTTFNLPDFRRRVAVGSGGSGTDTLANTVGATGGYETHTLTTGEMPSHAHQEQGTTPGGPPDSVAPAYARGTTSGGVINYGPALALSGVNVVGPAVNTVASGSSGAHNNMQPSAVVLKIIKI